MPLRVIGEILPLLVGVNAYAVVAAEARKTARENFIVSFHSKG